MRSHRCGLLLSAALAVAWLVPAESSAQSHEQLLREASSYLDRGSCESARAILDEIPPDQRTSDAHMLAARAGRCLGDVEMVIVSLDAFEASGGSDPSVTGLRQWLESSIASGRADFTSALEQGDCTAAESARKRLEASAQATPIDRAFIARCEGDFRTVAAVIGGLDETQLGAPQRELLESFVREAYSALQADFEADLADGDCTSAASTLQELHPPKDASTDENSRDALLGRAQLARCMENTTELAQVLAAPALADADDERVAALREWLSTGPVPVAFEVLSGDLVVFRGEVARGSVAGGTATVPLPVPPHRVPVLLSIPIPGRYDVLEKGPYSVRLDPRLHPAVAAYERLSDARQRARPYGVGTAVLAGGTVALLTWGGVETALAHSAAQEANRIDDPREKQRFLDLQAQVVGAYPRIGIAFGLASVSLGFTIALPTRGASAFAAVRKKRREWSSAAAAPVDWKELVR